MENFFDPPEDGKAHSVSLNSEFIGKITKEFLTTSYGVGSEIDQRVG